MTSPNIPENLSALSESQLESLLRQCRQHVFDDDSLGQAIDRIKAALAPYWRKRESWRQANAKHWTYAAE